MPPLLLLLAACAPPRASVEAPDCTPGDLAAGQVRVCRMGSGELPSSVGARASDWRLQNAQLELVIRDAYVSLTRLDGAGGTLVAALVPGHADPVLELTPVLPGGWFRTLDIDPVLEDDAASLVLTGEAADGSPATMTWRLPADSHTIELEGATGFTLLPQSGAPRVGGTLEHGEVVVAGEGAWTDSGGEITWEETDRVHVGLRADSYRARWPEHAELQGEAPGADHVELWQDGSVVGRLPVDDGLWSGPVPVEVDALVATASGHADGPAHAVVDGARLPLGRPGFLRIRVADERGEELWATVERDGATWAVPPGGATLPVGPGAADTVVWAGPAYQAAQLPALSVQGEVEQSIQLGRVVAREPLILAELGQRGWPQRDIRGSVTTALQRTAARGVGFVVVVAEDEVATGVTPGGHLARALRTAAGSAAATDDAGTPFAWPWTADLSEAAHGAAPWSLLDPWQLLSLLDLAGSRNVVLDLDYIEAAGRSPDGPIDALGLRLDSLADLPAWLALVDRGEHLSAVGPWTWVEGVDPDAYSAVDVERRLWEGRTVASTGPRIRLRVEGEGPGSLVEPGPLLEPPADQPWQGEDGALHVSLRVETPSWAAVDTVALYGPGGQELGRWPARSGGVPAAAIEVTLPVVDWLVAAAWGEGTSPLTGAQPWAITTPVWVTR